MLRPPVLAVALAATLLLSSCSGGDSSEEPDRARVDEGLAALYAGDHPSEEDAAAGECFAHELSDVTVAQLRDAGVVDGSDRVVTDLPPLDQGLAETWVDAQLACVDFVEASTRAQQRITKGKIDAEAYADCLRDALTDDELHQALVATVRAAFDDPSVNRLAQAQDTCAARN